MKNSPHSGGHRKHIIRAHYEPRLRRHREHHKILDWASPQSQQARFRVLADNVPLEGLSLLDVGCGLGDLRSYLLDRNIHVQYTGVDISEKMVQAARQRHPSGRGAHAAPAGDGCFIYADIFEDCPFAPRSFDVVYGSGIFNLNLGNNRQFMAVAIARLQELTRRWLVFNLLHTRALSGDDRYFHHNPQDILDLLHPSGWRVRLIDDYLPNDFTLVCQR